MYAGIFDMFGDGIFNDFTVLCHCVEFYFLGVLHELRYDYRIFLRYFAGHLQEAFQFFFIVADIHGCAGQYI